PRLGESGGRVARVRGIERAERQHSLELDRRRPLLVDGDCLRVQRARRDVVGAVPRDRREDRERRTTAAWVVEALELGEEQLELRHHVLFGAPEIPAYVSRAQARPRRLEAARLGQLERACKVLLCGAK